MKDRLFSYPGILFPGRHTWEFPYTTAWYNSVSCIGCFNSYPCFLKSLFPVLIQFFNVDSAELRYLIVGIKYYYRSGVS